MFVQKIYIMMISDFESYVTEETPIADYSSIIRHTYYKYVGLYVHTTVVSFFILLFRVIQHYVQ